MVASLTAAVVVLSVVVAALSWLVHGLLRQNRRVLQRLDVLERESTDASPGRRAVVDRSLTNSRFDRDINPEGLPVGTMAPVFRLPTVDGRAVALADYAGRRVLLVFSDPACGPCMDLLPRLDAAARVSEVPVLVISRGTVDVNRDRLVEARSSLTVALQANWEISNLYASSATPN